MATVSKHLLASTLTPIVDVSTYHLTRKVALASGDASNGDNIQLATILRGGRLFTSHLRTSGTLGAGATLKLQRNRGGTRVDLTGATTAGGASYVNGSAIGPLDVQAGDIIEALVGGANIAAAADIEVDLSLQH
jgi:hypothetical protein